MSISKKIIVFLLLILLNKSFSYAQYIYPITDGWGVGANFGLNYFYGDVNDDEGRIWNNTPLSSFYYTDKNIMGSLCLSKTISQIWGVRGHFTFGHLSGNNEKTNMYFKGTVYTFDMDVTFQYLDYFLKRPESCKFKYYAFAGLGLTQFNSVRKEISTDVFQNATGGYNIKSDAFTHFTTEATVKLGLGIAYQLDKKWLFNFETSLNYLNTDYLDAYISTASKLEGYGYMSLGFVYKFDLDFVTGGGNQNDLLKKSSGDLPKHNPGVENKRKKKLRNKWKK